MTLQQKMSIRAIKIRASPVFDLSFSEFIVISLVGLLCIGPKELPGVLRAVGRVVGGAKRQVQDFLQDVQQLEEEETHRIQGDDGKYYEAYDVKGLIKDERP